MGFFLKGGTLGPPGLEGVRQLGSLEPRALYPFIGVLLPWLAWGAAATCALGFGLGFLAIAEDARRGDLYAIVLIHVPAAWMSVAVFGVLALCSGAALLLRARLFAMMAQALAPTGALFALLTLWTGSLWGKPVWGTWWDPRLAAEIALLAVYAAIITLRSVADDDGRADRIIALVTLLGFFAVPGVLSVAATWRAFHDVPLAPARPGATTELTAALLVIVAGLAMYAAAVALKRLRCVILERERRSGWVEEQSDWLAARAGRGE